MCYSRSFPKRSFPNKSSIAPTCHFWCKKTSNFFQWIRASDRVIAKICLREKKKKKNNMKWEESECKGFLECKSKYLAYTEDFYV
ncbi:hypothetical protein P8452_45391 [Trifolium repens]|nr:hypothetical protein P8452_45391 [Trifolium repens]